MTTGGLAKARLGLALRDVRARAHLRAARYADPAEHMVAIVMTQRMPPPSGVVHDVWTSAYQAIDD